MSTYRKSMLVHERVIRDVQVVERVVIRGPRRGRNDLRIALNSFGHIESKLFHLVIYTTLVFTPPNGPFDSHSNGRMVSLILFMNGAFDVDVTKSGNPASN